jgi:16S rRNA (cytidine1402-2'-O)-methyltransferase
VSTLFVVATPIGNLEDVTLRSLRVLAEARLVLAEDTRRTRVLLDRHGVKARPRSLHAHNERSRIDEALAVLDAGGDVALVSDAGTPLISDPGERLVAAVIAADHDVVPVPGASAVLAALSISGLRTVPFCFVGFLPRRRGECERLLASLADRPDTLVLFESPRRLAATLTRLSECLGDRPACVARELTKRHEQAARGTLGELATAFAEPVRGEITIVVEGTRIPAAAWAPSELDAAIREGLAAGQGTGEIAEQLSKQSRLSRREVYGRVVALKAAGDESQ